MKKLTGILLFFLIAVTIQAQNPVSFGPKIGWNSSRLSTNINDYIMDIKSGVQAGFFFGLYSKHFYIQPEAYFSLKRGEIETSIGDPLNPGSTIAVRQTIMLQSVDVPLFLGVKVIDLKLARLRVFGGPVASYVLNKQYTLSLNGQNQTEKITAEDFRNATWSVQLGAGLDLLMLTFDVGYEFGLNNFLSINSLDDMNFRNNLFYCSLGWRLF